MPQQVTIQATGEVWEFPDNATPEQIATAVKQENAAGAARGQAFIERSQAIAEGLPEVTPLPPEASWISKTIPIPAFTPPTPESEDRRKRMLAAQGNWSPAAYDWKPGDVTAPAANLPKFSESQQPVTTVEKWAVEKVPVFKPLREWIGVEGTTHFMRGLADAPAGVVEFFSSPIGVPAAMAGAAPPTRLLTSAAFFADLSTSLKQQVEESITNWGQISDRDKGRALAAAVSTGAFALMIGSHLPKQAKAITPAGPLTTPLSELGRPEVNRPDPGRPYRRGEKPAGYQAPFAVVEPEAPLPKPEPASVPLPMAMVQPVQPLGPIGDQRKLKLLTDMAEGRTIAAADVMPGEEVIIEPQGYVREGEVWVNRSLLLNGPKLPKLLGGGVERGKEEVQERPEVTRHILPEGGGGPTTAIVERTAPTPPPADLISRTEPKAATAATEPAGTPPESAMPERPQTLAGPGPVAGGASLKAETPKQPKAYQVEADKVRAEIAKLRGGGPQGGGGDLFASPPALGRGGELGGVREQLYAEAAKEKERVQREYPPIYERIVKASGLSQRELSALLIPSPEQVTHYSEVANLASDLARNAPGGRVNKLYDLLAAKDQTGRFYWGGTAENPRIGFDPDVPGKKPDPAAARRALGAVNAIREVFGYDPMPNFFGSQARLGEPAIEIVPGSSKSGSVSASPPALGPGGEIGDAPPPRNAVEADPYHSVFDAVPMEMPEAVQVIKTLTGDYPKIRQHLRALGGQAAGVFSHGRGEGAKGSIALKAGIFDLLTREEKERIRQEAADYARANNLGEREARDYLQTKFEEAYEEAKSRNPVQAMKVVWHEIGHLVDWLPDKIISGRGNLFGRIGALKNYLKHTFPVDPSRPAGERMTPGDLAKLKRDAAAAVQAEIGPMREIIETIMVEEPIYREAGITPDMVKRLFGMDAREAMPELYKWFAEQPADVKKEIVRAAMKGLVDERLKQVAGAGREQIGTRQVPRTVRRREGRMPTPAEIEAKFKVLLRQEILRRNLAELKTVKAELEPVIAWWRGTERMEEYFRPSPEMYAEAFSVFANNPAALASRAPIYSRMLWNYLERKPEVRALYDQIQSDIKAGRVMGNRVKNLREMWERDARTSLDLDHSRNKITGREFLDNVRYHLDRRFGPVYRLTRGYSREGQVREAIGSFLYRATEHERFLGNVNDRVGKPLVRHSLDWTDLGEYLFHKRVIEERFNMANPLGWTPKNSLERLAEMQRDLGAERWSALEQAGQEFRAQYEDAVTRPLAVGRMFTPELQAVLDARTHYATFSAIKGVPDNGLERILAGQYGSSVTPHIFRQIGMAGEIKNPASATMLKGLSLITANARNVAKREIARMIQARDPESIAPAKMRWNGKTREPVIIETPKVGTLVWLDEGKVQAAYVRRHVADAVNAGNATENMLLGGMRNATGWLKGLFTQLNYAFWPVNYVRDTLGWQMQVPGGGPISYARVLPRAMAAARQSVTRKKPNPYAEQALRRRMVISQSDPRGVWAAADNEFDLQVARMGLDPAAWSKHADKVHVLARAWNHYRELGQTLERVNKIAGMIHLDERYPTMPEWKKREIVRERAGSPNFLERGASNPYVDLFMLFYNPWKEGIRSVGKSAAENPWTFAGKAGVGLMVPAVLQAAAVNGWLGDDLKEKYRSVSDYDLTNYLIPPPKWVDAKQAKVAHLRLPLWEPARVAHGVLFQLLTNRGQGLTSFAGGQLPGLNPILSSALAWIQYAQGQNPQDRHRGVGVLSDTQQAARPQSWEGTEQMLKWTWNNLGGSVAFRFQNPNLESPPDGTAEKFLGLPGINNLLGRWVKVTDRGVFDEQRREGNEIEAKRAAVRLAVAPVVEKVLNGTELTEAERIVLRDPYALEYFMGKYMELLPGREHILFRLLNDAQTKEEKMGILMRQAGRR